MKRVLVAGVGNVSFGDDGFGVEVVQRLASESWPEGVSVRDFGVRGVHLARELLESVDLLVAIDSMSRSGSPGTMYLFEPDLDAERPEPHGDEHGMDLPGVFAIVRSMGGTLPRVLVVGCEPEDTSPRRGLSAAVAQAVEPAAGMVRRIIARIEETAPRVHSTEFES